MRPVGYLINTERGPEGNPGLFYNYVLAQNGLFIRAESPLIAATISIAGAYIRGISPLREEIKL